MLAVLSYLKRRLGERSTWVAIGLGIPAAAVLSLPWSAMALIVAVIGTLVPEPKAK